MIEIRKAEMRDHDAIWEIVRVVIAAGDTYVFDPASPREKMMAYWCGADKYTYVAAIEGKVVGTFFIKENQPDLGSHVANAGFITSRNHAGRGVGRTMGAHALEEAKRLGFTAMQFNIVIKTNEHAVALWKKLGFEIIGEIPDAFNHKQKGMTNAYIMYRKL